MRSGWLLRDGNVVCALELADSPAERGALRGRTGCEGALHVDGLRTVHTVGMKFPIDVAFLSTDLTVVRLSPAEAVAGGTRWAGGPERRPDRGGVVRTLGRAGGRPARAARGLER